MAFSWQHSQQYYLIPYATFRGIVFRILFSRWNSLEQPSWQSHRFCRIVAALWQDSIGPPDEYQVNVDKLYEQLWLMNDANVIGIWLNVSAWFEEVVGEEKGDKAPQKVDQTRLTTFRYLTNFAPKWETYLKQLTECPRSSMQSQERLLLRMGHWPIWCDSCYQSRNLVITLDTIALPGYCKGDDNHTSRTYQQP